MPDLELVHRNNTLQNNAVSSSNTIHINDLGKEEKAVVEETNKIALEAVRQTKTPSSSDKMTSSVTLDEKNPEVTNIAIQSGVIQKGDEAQIDLIIKADVVEIKEEKDPSEMLKEVQTHLEKELDAAKEKKDEPRVNYLTQMNRLVAELAILLNDWVCRDNARTEANKLKYSEGSASIQENHYTKGNYNLVFGVIGAAIGLYPPTQALSNSMHSFVTAFNGRMDGNITEPSQNNSMILQKMQHDKESSSSNTSLTDLARRMLDEARQLGITAARHS